MGDFLKWYNESKAILLMAIVCAVFGLFLTVAQSYEQGVISISRSVLSMAVTYVGFYVCACPLAFVYFVFVRKKVNENRRYVTRFLNGE